MLELKDDQKLEDVMEDDDTLTIFKQTEDDVDEGNAEAKDIFVVILSSTTSTMNPIFLRPREASKLNLRKLSYKQRIAVFRSEISRRLF